jgi:murein DD-endopeptidase MepM/ murein hydrolase activator NlpD
MQFSVTITQGYQGQPEDEAVTTEEFSLGTDPVVETRPTFQDPVNGYISQSFHWYHPGVDIAGNMNQKIRPIMNGRVVMIERSGYGYGNNVVIEHSDGFYSRYAHMAVIQVELNQEVNHESVLGVVGSTGRSTGYHLHLEVYKDNKAVNPLAYIPDTYSRTFVDVSTQETESIGKVVVASSNATNEEVRTLGMTKEMSTSFVSKEVADNYEEMDPYSQAQ